MAKPKKSLSNNQHIKVLEVIGRSNVPLSSRGIEKRIVRTKYSSSDSYVYTIVRELAGIEPKTFLFTWEDIPEKLHNADYKRGIVKTIDSIIGLNWDIKGKEDPTNNKLLDFKLIRDSELQIITLHHTENKNTLLSVLDEKDVSNVTMCVTDNNNKVKDRMRLKIERNRKDNKLQLYIIDPSKSTTSFLRITNKYDSLIKEMQRNKKLLPDRHIITDKGYDYVFIGEVTEEDEKKQEQIQKMQSDIRNYRYSLTLKGLLLYLQKAYNIGEIDAVLRNLSTNYPSEFPFLWSAFSNIFDIS